MQKIKRLKMNKGFAEIEIGPQDEGFRIFFRDRSRKVMGPFTANHLIEMLRALRRFNIPIAKHGVQMKPSKSRR